MVFLAFYFLNLGKNNSSQEQFSREGKTDDVS